MSMEEKEWRKLCELITNERDPQQLSQLVDQLIETLDSRKRDLHRKGQQPNSTDKL
jgi:hypothetical protein